MRANSRCQLVFRRLPLVFLLILGCFTIVAQTRISLTSRGDLASTFGYSSPSDNGYSTKDNKKIGLRTSFGVELARFTKDDQAILYGLEYVTSGFNYAEPVWVVDVNTPNAVSGPPNDLAKGGYTYHFISSLLGYRWYRSVGDFNIYGQFYMVPMFYLKANTKYSFGTYGGFAETLRNDDFQDFHLAASTAIGVERPFFKSWTIGLQPTFRAHLTSVTTTQFKERPWTLGLQLNIGRQLNRSNKGN